MDIVKDLDLEWFWLGYSVGFNSRKKLIDSPNRIVNLGKQGLKKIPNEKQKVSFFIGMKLGRGRITQNLDIVTRIQYQDKNPHKNKGNYLTLEVQDKDVERGATFNVPLMLCNNSVDNRGYCGYQAKLQYNPKHLRFNSIKSTNPSLSFKYQHNASSGIVLIQGMREAVGYEDCYLCEMSFTVLSDVPSSTTISVCGPGGTGTASDIFTKINGELYYIMPVCLESGTIKIQGDEPKPKPEPPPEAIKPPPQGDSNTIVGSGSDFTYDFEMDLNHIGGPGAGATGKVEITFGDGSSVIVDIPLQEGSHRYQGKIPLPLPSLKPGPIYIDIWVESNDPNDEYYWFIKAGALWGFEIETPRDEVGQIVIEPPERRVFENFILYDYFELYQEGESPTPTPSLSDISINDLLIFYDTYSTSSYKMKRHVLVELLEFFDSYIEERFYAEGYEPDSNLPEVEELLRMVDKVDMGLFVELLREEKDNSPDNFNIQDAALIWQD